MPVNPYQLFTAQMPTGDYGFGVNWDALTDADAWVRPILLYIAGPDPVTLRADGDCNIFATNGEAPAETSVLLAEDYVYINMPGLFVVGDGQRMDALRRLADVGYDHPLYRLVSLFKVRHGLNVLNRKESGFDLLARPDDWQAAELAVFLAPGLEAEDVPVRDPRALPTAE